MKKIGLFALVFLLSAACGGDAPNVEKQTESQIYVVISSIADPATRSLTVSIKVDQPVTEARVKQAAEAIIKQNTAQYENITVKSFVTPQASGLSVGTSTYSGGVISHQFNPQATPQKIPSH